MKLQLEGYRSHNGGKSLLHDGTPMAYYELHMAI